MFYVFLKNSPFFNAERCGKVRHVLFCACEDFAPRLQRKIMSKGGSQPVPVNIVCTIDLIFHPPCFVTLISRFPELVPAPSDMPVLPLGGPLCFPSRGKALSQVFVPFLLQSLRGANWGALKNSSDLYKRNLLKKAPGWIKKPQRRILYHHCIFLLFQSKKGH